MIRRALARLILRLIGPELREIIRAQSITAVADAERRGGILLAHRNCDAASARRGAADAEIVKGARVGGFFVRGQHPEAS